jgi:hypothetical protein
MNTKIAVSWDVSQRGLAEKQQHFVGCCCLEDGSSMLFNKYGTFQLDYDKLHPIRE